MNKADLILYNARVITLDPERPKAELVAVKGNRILAIGEKDDLDQLSDAGTKLVDCENGTVIPGFNDAHCHPLSFAAHLLSVDCSPGKVRNIADILAAVRRRADRTKKGGWVRAAGYDDFRLEEGRLPTRWDLDKASPRHPVVLTDATAGKCVLNSLALQLAGIDKNAPESAGGTIYRDPVTGQPTGLISGRNDQVEKAIPPLVEEELEEGVGHANREYLSHGITSLQDTSWNNDIHRWRVWRRLVNRRSVSPRVSMLVGTKSLEEFIEVKLETGSGDDRLRVGGLKLALDESTGSPHPAQADIDSLALRACEAGYQVAFHVSDAHMLRASLSAIDFVNGRLPSEDPRFRLEHCPICPPDMLLKIKARHAIVVAQPAFLYYLGERNRDAVLPHQTGWFWPIGSLQRWGVNVAMSSDSPLVDCDPITGIYAAVTRKTESGRKLAPQEAVSPLDALRMYTLSGAFASFQEEAVGSITPGKLADFAVLSDDPTQMRTEELRNIQVTRTIIDGEIIWER